MAKGTITPSAITVNNIQGLPDVVVGQATSLKTLFDKSDADQQDYINNTLIPELNGDDGSKKIGHSSLNISADNVNEAIEEVYAAIASTVIGEIPNNSITNAKLSADVKVGSLALLETTEKTSVVGAINELEGEVDTLISDVGTLTTSVGTNTTNLEILRKFNTTTGSNVALAVDTFGTFDLTLNGNILNVLPNVTNTGAMTINPDGQGAKSIKKFNTDTDAYVDIEAGDVKKNTPLSLNWSLANGFFVLAPKGGASIKSIQRGTLTITTGSSITQAITPVNTSKSVIIVSVLQNDGTNTSGDRTVFRGSFDSASQIRFTRGLSVGITAYIAWQVIEFNNVKSLQSGTHSFTVGSISDSNVTISSIDTTKSILFASYSTTYTTANSANYLMRSRIDSSTQISFNLRLGQCSVHYFVVEFN